MPGIFPVLGGTETEAKAHYGELQAIAPPSAPWTTLRNPPRAAAATPAGARATRELLRSGQP